MFTIPTTVDEDLEAVFEIDKAKTHNEMQIGEALETNLYYHNTHHFWDFVSKNCSNLETVKFINFHRQTEGSNPSELGIRWVLLAIYQREDLFEAFMAIVSDQHFMFLYSMDDSYAWQCKREIFQVLELLKGKNMYNECQILDDFIKSVKNKEPNRKELFSQYMRESSRKGNSTARSGMLQTSNKNELTDRSNVTSSAKKLTFRRQNSQEFMMSERERNDLFKEKETINSIRSNKSADIVTPN